MAICLVLKGPGLYPDISLARESVPVHSAIGTVNEAGP